ncbi:MAG: peptidoglycan binding domain-containing protein, partial [Anaerolineales bacterium]|nr:peptidoglycan binding domain-containing protein [Anaerolineales bacterium]
MKITKSSTGIIIRTAAALTGGFLLFVLVISLGSLGFRTVYQGRIFPGIYLGWVNLSGQTPTDAAELLRAEYTYPDQGQITLQYDDLSWDATPAELGFFFSPNYNTELAFQTGRKGDIAERIAAQIQVLRNGIILAPQFVLDEKTGTNYLEEIAAGVNQPVVEASLKLEGLEVLVQPGQDGREMDIPASLDVVALQ